MQREDYTSNKKKKRQTKQWNWGTAEKTKGPERNGEGECPFHARHWAKPYQCRPGTVHRSKKWNIRLHLTPPCITGSFTNDIRCGGNLTERRWKNTKSWQQRWRKLNRAWNLIWAETFFPPLCEYCCEVRTVLKAGGLCEPLVLKMTADKIKPKKTW